MPEEVRTFDRARAMALRRPPPAREACLAHKPAAAQRDVSANCRNAQDHHPLRPRRSAVGARPCGRTSIDQFAPTPDTHQRPNNLNLPEQRLVVSDPRQRAAAAGCAARLDIMDSPPETAYDEIAELAAQICGCPIGYISFVDDDRRWLKARYGLPSEATSAPREATVCSTTICGAEMFVVPDMTQDSRFDRIAVVVGEPHCRFYCGVPLITDEGYALGTLCVLDFEPRRLTFEQTEALRRLSRQVLTLLELRRKLIEHDRTIRQLDQTRNEVATQKARAEELLHELLPPAIADELKKNGRVRPRYLRSTTVLFADLQGFTLLAEQLSPRRSLVFSINISARSTTSWPVADWRKSRRSATRIWRSAACPRPSPASARRLPRGAGNASGGRPHKVAKRQNAIAIAGLAGRHSHRASHLRRRRQSPLHLRYLGRRREHGVVYGGALPAWPDQYLGHGSRTREGAFRTGAARSGRSQTRTLARDVFPQSPEGGVFARPCRTPSEREFRRRIWPPDRRVADAIPARNCHRASFATPS